MKNDVLKNIVFSIIQQIINIICGFIVPRLILNTYGSNINGMITSITQFLGYITLLEAGIAPVVKASLYKPIVKSDNETIAKILRASEKFFRTIAIVFIFYIIVLCIVFPNMYSPQYDYLFTLSLILIIAISTFFEYFFGMAYNIYLQAIQKNYVVSILKTILKVLNTIIVVVLVLNNCSVQVVKLMSSLIFLLSPIFLSLYVKNKYHISLKNVDSKNVLKNKWAGFSQHIAAILFNSVDVCVLTFATNSLEVSVYAVHMLVINSIKEVCVSLSSGIDAWFGSSIASDNIKKLNDNLSLYEFFFFSIVSFLFAATFSLQIPFIKVYTKGIEDVNYIRPLFAYIMIFAQFFAAIRIPYTDIVLAAGHFKETQKYAWMEVVVNLVLSIILAIKYGIVGVAIGTLVATFIRTWQMMCYSSKKIIKRPCLIAFKKTIIAILEIILIFVINKVLNLNFANTYLGFILRGITTSFIAIVVICLVDVIFYRDNFKKLIIKLKQKFRRGQNE